MITQFTNGFSYTLEGFRLLFNKNIRAFVIVPLLINILVFSGAIWLGIDLFQSTLIKMTEWLPNWLDWLQWLLWPLVIVLIFVAVYYTFTILANLIAAPFNSLLSERIEAHLRGEIIIQEFSYKMLPSIIGRTTWSEIRKILNQLKWVISLVILSFIPIVNFVTPFAWGYFSAWMLAIEYADYPMGNHGLYFLEEKRILKSDRTTALGLGSGIMLMSLIPIVNLFAMPTGVAAGTAYWVKHLDKKRSKSTP